MSRRPSEVITGIRTSHTKARASLDSMVTSGEFMSALIDELRKEAPSFLTKFITPRAFTIVRLKDGWSLLLHNHKDEGQLLAYWNFGIPHPFRIPKVGNKKLFFPALGIVRENAVHPAVAPDKFIYRAWHRVLNRYTMRIKREIERSFRSG
ncbi:MAG: hypothetical protein WC479_08420 [Candidatus Izemoplasmatales bacterium]